MKVQGTSFGAPLLSIWWNFNILDKKSRFTLLGSISGNLWRAMTPLGSISSLNTVYLLCFAPFPRKVDLVYSPISNKERDSTFTIGSERFPRYSPYWQNKNNDDSGSKGVGIGIFLFWIITRFPGGLEVRDRSFRTKGIPLMLQEVADWS